MEWLGKHYRGVVLGLLVLTNAVVWNLYFERRPTDKLNVYFLDIGQGDAIYIDTPHRHQMILDGGPSAKVLSEMSRYVPFGDRSIDIVMESHPDADHIAGLVDVFDRYEVSNFLEPGVKSENNIHKVLEEKIEKENISKIVAKRGMVIDFKDGVTLEILFPNQDVSDWETNDASVVAKLTYGEKSFLLTGDSAKKTEYILLGLNKEILDVDVLKVGHHGSKNSTSLQFAQSVSPEYAVISAGAENKYGHPAKEVLDVLNQVDSQVLATETAGGLKGSGTIRFETDGYTLKVK